MFFKKGCDVFLKKEATFSDAMFFKKTVMLFKEKELFLMKEKDVFRKKNPATASKTVRSVPAEKHPEISR